MNKILFSLAVIALAIGAAGTAGAFDSYYDEPYSPAVQYVQPYDPYYELHQIHYQLYLRPYSVYPYPFLVSSAPRVVVVAPPGLVGGAVVKAPVRVQAARKR